MGRMKDDFADPDKSLLLLDEPEFDNAVGEVIDLIHLDLEIDNRKEAIRVLKQVIAEIK